jgi:glycosyltransferase involved in cell wall biosynthesis
MKLLYITNAISGSGGLERVLSIKASYLADRLDYEVHILTLNDAQNPLFYDFSPKINIHNITVQGGALHYISAYYSGIRTSIRVIQPQVISVCDDGLKGFFIPKILPYKLPVVYERHVSKAIEMHRDFSFWKKGLIQLKWRIMDNLAKSFSVFVVLTQGNTNEWFLLQNLKIIPNPLSFYPETVSSLQNKKVIAVGKQSYQKGYDLLLKAWQIVQVQHPDWELEIYGKKEATENLELQAHELQIGSSVHFFDPEKNIEQKYLSSSIYVMSSRYEGFGMVLIEAMACGVPCVSFDCNYGPADIISNNADGFVVAKEDYKALAQKITILIADEVLRKEMGQCSRSAVKRYFPEHIVKQWDGVFKSLAT